MRLSLLLCLFVLWLNMDVSLAQNDPVGCKKPPLLADGDTKETSRFSYRHNERVEYICQNYYTMDGDPHKTCINGEWSGEMRCRKPCTVNTEAMSRHNIAFRYTHDDKLYSRHNEEIEFRCVGRRRHDGRLNMRQRCRDGVMQLPSCQ
ncbi:complement factor H-related protein 3-like [Chelmon rostratus]|uniref:complement factor H-related protein 3-like n=1 Tax=Chelmon rostratus TaxID=109905 RepID=UPI001BEB48D8|nr:complement factor H-related protein 3-like [Chelmon rostratus]